MSPVGPKQLLFLSGADPQTLDGWGGGSADGCLVNLALEPQETVAMVELWGGVEHASSELRALGFQVRAMAVEERIERWTRSTSEGGLVQVAAWRRRPDLTRDEARSRWDEHVRLALAVHGAANYVRNWINGPAVEGGPCGVAVLTYADVGDYHQHRYTRAGDAERIAADVGRFMQGVEVFLAELRVVRSPPRPI